MIEPRLNKLEPSAGDLPEQPGAADAQQRRRVPEAVQDHRAVRADVPVSRRPVPQQGAALLLSAPRERMQGHGHDS